MSLRLAAIGDGNVLPKRMIALASLDIRELSFFFAVDDLLRHSRVPTAIRVYHSKLWI